MNANEPFNRGLKDEFVEALNREYEKGSWWKTIVHDPDLFIGIRENYLNVYFKGASLLKLKHTAGHLIGKTHFKYLLKDLHREGSKNYVKFEDGHFRDFDTGGFYNDMGKDLKKIKETPDLFQGDEKKGVHQIIIDNKNAIDTEIAFGKSRKGSNKKQFDFAALWQEKNGLKLVFYEAKVFSSREIRAKIDKPPPVIDQIERYEKLLSERMEEIWKSYRRVAANILDLTGYASRRSDLLQQAKDGNFDICPEVRLVIFNFDNAPKEGSKCPQWSIYVFEEETRRKSCTHEGSSR